ncbi:MAG: amidohydrolase family protein [Mycobacteriales bacterium]
MTHPDGGLRDIRLADGLVERIAEPGVLPAGDESADLTGFLVLPAPAEPHAHYDTALTATRAPNPGGTLVGAVDAWRTVASTATHHDYVRRATEVALMALANGATSIRTHVGIYPEVGLRAVEALLEVREQLSEWVDLQLVALTVELTTPDGKQVEGLLREALGMGVDVVGGCPHLDPDPKACIDAYLDLAVQAGKPVDLHMDEQLDPGVDNLPYLAGQVRERGLRGRVTASHCVSLGTQPLDHAREVAEDLADAGVAVVSNPQTNLYLQARGLHTMAPRGLTAVRPLLAAGAVLAGGGDNVQDPFNPMGRADPLETGSLLVTAGHLTSAEAYHAVSAGARAALCLPEVRLAAGYPAEILALRARSLDQALADPTDRLVIHQGRVVSRTTVTRRRPQPPSA